MVAQLALRLKHAIPRTTPHPCYNLWKLQDPALQQLLAVEVSNCFSSRAKEDMSDWQLFKENLNTIAATNPGIAKPSKKPWISHTSLHLTEEKHSARLLGHTSKLKQQMKLTRANIRQDKQKWADDLATEQKQIL